MSWLVNNKPKDQKMIKIEFPSDRSDIALAIGRALIAIGQAEGLDGGQLETSVKTDTRTDQEKTEERDKLYQHNPEAKPGETQTRGDSHGTYEHVGKTGEFMEEVSEIDPRVDEKLVIFDAKYCGEAAVPFYASGKRKGQWKKRKSVEEVDYDEWYASKLEQTPTQTQIVRDEPAPDPEKAANAFKKSPVVDVKAPANFGELMAWFSGQQTAGNYESHHLEQAFKTLNLSTLDLVQDPTGANIAAVYEYLA
jgi:hypothetical protein